MFDYLVPFFKEKVRIWSLVGIFLVFYFYSYFISPMGTTGSIYLIEKTRYSLNLVNFFLIVPGITFLLFFDVLSFDRDKEYLNTKPKGMLKIRVLRWLSGVVLALVILFICFSICFFEKVAFEKVLPNGNFIRMLICSSMLKPLFFIVIFSSVVTLLGILISNEFLVLLLSFGLWFFVKQNYIFLPLIIVLLLLVKFIRQKLNFKFSFKKFSLPIVPNSFLFMLLFLFLGYFLFKSLNYDKTIISYNLFEITYPYFFSFIAFGILSAERKNNLLERISIIPGSFTYIFKKHIASVWTMWLIIGVVLFILYLLEQNTYVLILCFYSNLLFWSGIYVIIESLGCNPILGVILSFLIFVFWLFPQIEKYIGGFGAYRYINPFYLTFHYSSPAWVEKVSIGLIGISLYSVGYIVLKKKRYIEIE